MHSSFFSFNCVAHHPDLHSFPTRRSSDLARRHPRRRTDRAPAVRRGRGEGVLRALFPRLRGLERLPAARRPRADRKSTRLNSSHVEISYAVFCLKKKKNERMQTLYQEKRN